MQILLNNYSLTSVIVIADQILADNAPVSNLNAMVVYRRDRSKLVSQQFTAKTITIRGNIVTATASELQAIIDAIKLNCTGTNMNLDITFDSGETRRYVAEYSSLDLPREATFITTMPFSLELMVTDPVAITSTPNSVDYTMTGTTLSASITISGTIYPEPVITFTPNVTLSTLSLYNSYLGQTLTISGTIPADNIVIIDEANYSITVSGVETDYSGVIPKFTVGVNNMVFTANTSLTDTPINILYYSRWL